MAWCMNELSVDDLLADPLTRALMAADRVDPVELTELLTGTASRLSPPTPGEQNQCNFA